MTARVRVLFLLSVLASAYAVRGDVINACVDKKGSLRIVLGDDTCKKGETALSWSGDGPAGAAVVGSISFDGGVAIPVYEINGSFENPTTLGSATGGAGAGKVKFNEFTIKKTVDAQSPVLFTKLATGTHFNQVVLNIQRPGTTDATLTLGLVFLTSLSHVSTPGSNKTFEKVGFVFGNAALAADGARACWNQVTNVSCP